MINSKEICTSCMGPYLEDLIQQIRTYNEDCGICGSKNIKHFKVNELIKKIKLHIKTNFSDLAKHPYQESDYFYGNREDGIYDKDAILDCFYEIEDMNLYEIICESLEDIPDRLVLNCYIENPDLSDNPYNQKWNELLNSLHYKFRFHNTELNEFLNDIFTLIKINNHLSTNIITKLEKKTHLFRARSFDSYEDIHKIITGSEKKIRDSETKPFDKHKRNKNIKEQFGTVPKELSSDQRMSPFGIPALYLSSNEDTCISEIRAMVGQYVGIAKFEVFDSVRLLDIEKLRKSVSLNSIFIENISNQIYKISFLDKLVETISKPKLNKNKFDYLISQYFFEYIRINFKDEIDGIIFPSIQHEDGKNIVFFPETIRSNLFTQLSQDLAIEKIVLNYNNDTDLGVKIVKVNSVTYTHTEI